MKEFWHICKGNQKNEKFFPAIDTAIALNELNYKM